MATIPAVVAEGNNLVQEKGRRKGVDRIVGEQIFKVKLDSILM